MGIGKRIREARLHTGLTQEDLALKLGVTKSAVANYEAETSHPKEAVLYKLFQELHVDANYLFQDVSGALGLQESLSPAERRHLQDYRMLTDYARETIDYLIGRELKAQKAISVSSILSRDSEEAKEQLLNSSSSRMETEKTERIEKTEKTQQPLPLHPEPETVILKLYPYLNMAASAGTGTYAEDIPQDHMEAPQCEHADFIIGVSGDSMEPLYHNGDRLYVERTELVSEGEIGIFLKDGSLYVKKAGRDRLISLNRSFPDILAGSGSISVIGRVLGRVNPGFA